MGTNWCTQYSGLQPVHRTCVTVQMRGVLWNATEHSFSLTCCFVILQELLSKTLCWTVCLPQSTASTWRSGTLKPPFTFHLFPSLFLWVATLFYPLNYVEVPHANVICCSIKLRPRFRLYSAYIPNTVNFFVGLRSSGVWHMCTDRELETPGTRN